MGLQRVGHDSATELPEFYIAQMEFEFFYPLSGRIPSSNVSNIRIWRVRKFLVSYHAAAAAAKSLSHVRLCDPIDSSPPGCPSLRFSRQEHRSGLPFPSPKQESEK